MAMNRSKSALVVVSALAVLFAAAAVSAGVLDGLFKKSPADAAKAAGVVETADAVKVPLKALDSGKALFLAMDAGDRQLHYFLLRSPDGKYRAALDACDVCFRANKGYRQEGDRMICNNCGMKFASDKIGEKKGGCNPHPLANRQEEGYMIISKSDVAAGRDYFPGKRQ
ncbi:MAG: DUF2318 domain-containing protein [Thermodesulfobacteriota bacterium]